jgi:hypothetical protein
MNLPMANYCPQYACCKSKKIIHKTRKRHAGLVFAADLIAVFLPAFSKTTANYPNKKDRADTYDKNPNKNATIFYKKNLTLSGYDLLINNSSKCRNKSSGSLSIWSYS